MLPRSWIGWLVSVLLAGGSAARAATSETRPNLVFILADDLGWSDLGVQGSRYYETPHLDRLAAQGTRFTRHHTSPNCQPTRAAILSGQYPPRTGVYTVGGIDRFEWWRRPLRPVENVTALPLDRVTVANALQEAGYVTGMFGKWHLGNSPRHHPGRRGFTEAVSVSTDDHFRFTTDPPSRPPTGIYLADHLTDLAVDFLRRHRDQPFFLYLPHFAVHAPHQARPEWIERFRKKAPAGGHHDPTYAAMIASVDESVGRIMRELDALGLAGRTALVFSSDNGGVGGYAREGLQRTGDVTDNAPLRHGKGSLYEGGVRTPLIVRWPGVTRPGSTCATATIHVDLFPTFLEIAGVPPPKQVLDGESLVGLLRDPASRLKRDAIYQHFPGYLGAGAGGWRTTPVGSIERDDWKLLEFFEDGRLELYHLAEDPGEQRNLAARQPERARTLQGQLARWRQEIGAPMPTPHPAGTRPGALKGSPEPKSGE